jgi:hypothetical protein
MSIGTLGWWEAIKRFFQWVIGTYLEYQRRKKVRQEKKVEAENEYHKAQKEGDGADMLNSFEKMKRNRDE